MPYDEIAAAVDKSPAAVRQVAHRAREHVAARRPRMQVGRTEQQQVVERFLDAADRRDLQGLMDVLAPDVVVVADGGGLAQASLYPHRGAVPRRAGCSPGSPSSRPPTRSCRRRGSTAHPALRMDIGGALDTAMSFVIEDGLITRIFAIRNPEKLTRLTEETPLAQVTALSGRPARSRRPSRRRGTGDGPARPSRRHARPGSGRAGAWSWPRGRSCGRPCRDPTTSDRRRAP